MYFCCYCFCCLQNLDLDESELKNLLEEAYSYKGPKDKENKSETFKVTSMSHTKK